MTRRRRQPATVLIVTLGILVVLTAMVLVLAQRMRVEALCSANRLAAQQAAAVEAGAIQYVLAVVDGSGGRMPDAADLLCDGVQVGEGAFWILRSDPDQDTLYTFGLTDEAGKLNLNTATEDMLAELPGMTADVPAAILDWRDRDGELTEGGAESEFYLLLADPYECKNAPFETVEELGLVRLVTADLLWGEDANRNGVLDPNENDAEASFPPDNRDGRLQRGLIDYLTVWSREPNTDAEGRNRVNVNQASPRDLAALLAEAVSRDRLPTVFERARNGRPFKNALDFYLRTGLTAEEFDALADRITTSGAKTLVGRVNVLTASQAVLACLPELEEADAAALVAARPDASAASAPSAEATGGAGTGGGAAAEAASTTVGLAWVAEALPQEKAVAIGDYITTRSYQFSADIVATSADGRAFRRCRVVVDATESPPRLLYRKDLTHLGWPLDPEIRRLLREGVPLDEVLAETHQAYPGGAGRAGP